MLEVVKVHSTGIRNCFYNILIVDIILDKL